MRRFLFFAVSFVVASSCQPQPPKTEVATPLASCAGGAVLDDGSVETGYGFVPSATEGVYVQAFAAGLFPRRELQSVCVCWLKTRGEREDVAFDVVFFEKQGDRPAPDPYAVVPAKAAEVADAVATAGAFTEVDVTGVTLPEEGGFIGVRWNPSEESHLFLCTDTSEPTAPTDVFYREDRAPRWTHVRESRDPIFRPHRSVLLRARALPEGVPAPPPRELPVPSTVKPPLTAEPAASAPPTLDESAGR